MKKAWYIIFAASLFCTGCSSSTDKQQEDNTSKETTNLSITTLEVEEKYRTAGQRYWDSYPNNYTDMSSLYNLVGDEISEVIVGTWNATDDYGGTYQYVFHEDGTVSREVTGKTKNENYNNGHWKASNQYMVISDATSLADGDYYVCVLQDNDHVLIFRIHTPQGRPSTQAYLMERVQ